tara:strand:+ start:1968 stop:2969 length:1002 start_codon:yes stop_codon:yes gene_type:complete
MNLNFEEFFFNPVFVLTVIIGLDLLFGDPIYSLHPVRIVGRLQIFFEYQLTRFGIYGKLGGIILVLLLLIAVFSFFLSINFILSLFHWIFAWFWKIYLGWSFLALRDLLVHSKNVADAIENRNLQEARLRVSMIVGRETSKMDMNACGRATVESVSENLSDGVIAPLFYFCIFGIHGMIIYKVFNTLDSMIGYKNERYTDFGWFSAKIDDILNWIPARLSWILLSLTAIIFPGFSGIDAFKQGLRDYSKLNSPNAGWCEATAAGALKIKLCGPIWRGGKLAQDFWLGDLCMREGATFKDISRMNKLALGATLLGTIVFGFCLWLIEFIPFLGL